MSRNHCSVVIKNGNPVAHTPRSPFEKSTNVSHFSLFAVSAAASVVVDVADVIEAPLVVFDEQHDVAFLVTEAFFAVAVSVVHSDFAEAF